MDNGGGVQEGNYQETLFHAQRQRRSPQSASDDTIDVLDGEGETRYATTQGLNQLEVFAQKKTIHTATQLSTQIFETMGYVIDLQGMEKSMASGTPDYKGMGSFLLKKFFGFFPSWAGKFAGNVSIPVDLDPTIENRNKDQIEKLGLFFITVSTPTLQKLLAKEFNTFKELDDFNFGSGIYEHGIVVRGIRIIEDMILLFTVYLLMKKI